MKNIFHSFLLIFEEGKFLLSFTEKSFSEHKKKEDLFFDVIQNVFATFNPFPVAIMTHNAQDLSEVNDQRTGGPNSGQTESGLNEFRVDKIPERKIYIECVTNL
jgi:hypothetical protein